MRGDTWYGEELMEDVIHMQIHSMIGRASIAVIRPKHAIQLFREYVIAIGVREDLTIITFNRW